MNTRGRRRVRRGLSLITALLGVLMFAAGAAAKGPTVVVLPTTGIVDQGMAQYLADGIANAERDGAAAVVIKLNTPGGFLTTTNDIVGTLLEANVPVIVWVAPAGGFAASAGTFITLAGNIALMAPGTSIGAASPVGAEGEDIPETLHDKVYNDAIAKITAIAEERGRNVEWAVSAVKDAKSSPASEAVELGVVDGIAASLEDVISFANGREVTVAGEQVTLELTGAVTSEQTMSPFLSFIRLLSDPTIAFLLFSVGSAGLIAELWNPNFVTGILGGIAIILAFIGLGALPLNVGGLILVIFGIVLIGLELTVTSHGLLGFGGVLCLAIGATALFRPPTNPFEPLLQVAPLLIAVITVTAGAFVALVAFAAVRSRRYAQAGGVGLAVPSGTAGIVRRPLEPLGSIYAGGEEWSAKTSDGRSLERGTPVRVVGNAGLTLIVEPDRSPSSS
ncbi:MAG TPA: nodulation protein NfeD [Candidatus Polarisedimenticolia bacterium]|nr:nodulation protein NfeD [Candidatus Polarisedimenticolia bacterium]